MKKSKLFILVATLFMSLNVQAQSMDEEEAKSIITNVLQNNTEYLFADATKASPESAKTTSMEILFEQLQQFLSSNNVQDKAIGETIMSQNVNCVFLKRGDKHRAFAYVAKADIKEATGLKAVAKEPEPEPEIDIVQTEPKNDSEPVSPEATVTEPVREENAVVSDNGNETIIEVKNDVVEEVIDDASQLDFLFEDDQISELEEPTISTESYTRQEVLSDILRASNLTQLQIVLTHYKKLGAVITFDRYQKLSDPAPYYVVIHDKKGNVVAMLSPGRKSRTNLWNDKTVKIEDYAGLGYGAIAFKLAKLK